MPNLIRNFYKDGLYHVYNRGSEKKDIFSDLKEYEHFLKTITYYQQAHINMRLSLKEFEIKERKPPLLFEIICYCLMPNHFHLVLKDLIGNGISKGISNLQNSYTRYYNVKHNRIGALFQGAFKSIEVKADEQLLQVCRYVMLNPVTSKLVDRPEDYQWSSYREYINKSDSKLCTQDIISSQFDTIESFREFHRDYIEYARSLHDVKKLALEEI